MKKTLINFTIALVVAVGIYAFSGFIVLAGKAWVAKVYGC